jgi:hypothetical protein
MSIDFGYFPESIYLLLFWPLSHWREKPMQRGASAKRLTTSLQGEKDEKSISS